MSGAGKAVNWIGNRISEGWSGKEKYQDDKGNTYNTASFGIYNSLKRIFQIFDVPSTWDSPLKVKIKQIKKDENSILNLEIV